MVKGQNMSHSTYIVKVSDYMNYSIMLKKEVFARDFSLSYVCAKDTGFVLEITCYKGYIVMNNL